MPLYSIYAEVTDALKACDEFARAFLRNKNDTSLPIKAKQCLEVVAPFIKDSAKVASVPLTAPVVEAGT